MVQMLQCGSLALAVLGAPARSQVVTQMLPEQGAKKSGDFLLEVQPRIIAAGETVVPRWAIEGATKAVIEEHLKSSDALHNPGTFGGSESLPVRRAENTTYIVTRGGASTHSCASVPVRVRVKRR